MEFCQLQLNYIDWTFQGGKEKAELLEQYRIPVWVMEPLRGGRLARLSKQESAVLQTMAPQRSIPAWAFQFLQRIPNVTVILSDMSNLEQLKDNLATFETEDSLTKEEWDGLLALGGEMTNPKALACTACRYCTSHCPRGWTSRTCWRCITSTGLPAAASLPLWPSPPSHRTGSQAPASAAAAATEEFPRFSGGGAYKGAAGRINGGLWHRKAKWSVSSK